jgi:hypothetical protein
LEHEFNREWERNGGKPYKKFMNWTFIFLLV